MNVTSVSFIDVAAIMPASQSAAAPTQAVDVAAFQRSFAEASAPAPAPQAPALGSAVSEPGLASVLHQFEALNGKADQLKSLAAAMKSSAGELSPSQILEMTMQCHELVFQAELTSNVANRGSEGVQQLFRQQS